MRNRLWVALFFIGSYSYGQIPDLPLESYAYDTNYIVNYGHLMAIRLVSPRRLYDFRLRNRNTGDLIKYRPNLQSAFGLGFTYRWLAFDVVFNPKWNKKKTEKFGETNEFNLKGSLYLKKYMLEVYVRAYRGMHITNPDDYLNPWDGNYPYRPDLKSRNFAMSFIIPSNYKKYSPKTTFQLDGRMKQSAGSVMSVSTLYFSSLKADSSIVPVEYASSFSPYAAITRMNMVHLQQSVGYAYTFIRKKFYLTLSAFPGASLSAGAVDSEAGRYNPFKLNFILNSKNGIGYNSRRWYAGLYFIYRYQNIKLNNDVSLNYNLGEWRIFIGYRLHAPYILHSVIQN